MVWRSRQAMRPDLADGQRRPGVGQVLNGDAVVHVLGRLGREHPWRARIRPSVECEVLRVSAVISFWSSWSGRDRGDRRRRLAGDHAEVGLGVGQGGEDGEPGSEAAVVAEQGAELVGAPEVSEGTGVGQTGAHAGSASRMSTPSASAHLVEGGAPRHDGDAVAIAHLGLLQAALRQDDGRRPVAGSPAPGAGRDRPRPRQVPPVEPRWISWRPGAAEQRPVPRLGALVEEPLAPVRRVRCRCRDRAAARRPRAGTTSPRSTRSADEHRRRQVVGHLEHPPSLVEQLRRHGWHHLTDLVSGRGRDRAGS